VTRRRAAVEFGILGPLEVRLEGRPLSVGGAKQSAALALLLLRAGEIVSVADLIDELWGEDPPPSAAHSLEAYVSRLRRLLPSTGCQLVHRGSGYVLVLGDATLDAERFARLHDAASRAATGGDDRRASALATAALELWRGALLADIPLGAPGRAEAERLDERRLRVFEQRADAELRLSRHEEVVGELQPLVRQHPYRERLVALLMLALYRSGRPADALDIYERTRVALANDLGLLPSTELRELSGRIVRHDPGLRLAAGDRVLAAPPRARRSARALVTVAASLALAGFVVASGGSVRQVAAAAPVHDGARIALVLPRPAAPGAGDEIALYESRLRDYLYFETTYSSQVIVARDAVDAGATLARGDYDLVLWVGDGQVAQRFAPHVGDFARTRFVFLDASVQTLGLQGVSNASAVRFAAEETSELAGYLSGLVTTRASKAPVDAVSVVAAGPTPAARRVVAGFRRGVRQARTGIDVIVDFVPDEAGRGRCEQAANDQIDRGSDVVFVTAGPCGAGAAAVARLRNVWAAADGERSVGNGDHLLVRTYKELQRTVDVALASFKAGTLPGGRDIVLGLADDYAVGFDDMSVDVPAWVSSAVVRLCSSIREHAGAGA